MGVKNETVRDIGSSCEGSIPPRGHTGGRRPHKSIGKPPYLSPRVDPWVFLVIPRTYFRANIPNVEGGLVLAYNLMMFAIAAVCLAAIHLAFEERQRRQVKRCVGNFIAWMKEARHG
jgi:hypothetical protein